MALDQFWTLTLILFHHQTTTIKCRVFLISCCFLSYFIIKPQQSGMFQPFSNVVSYLISSSNHNCKWAFFMFYRLFLILFHHQTTTTVCVLTQSATLFLILFHHQTTTIPLGSYTKGQLFLILFHHQTTTIIYLFYHYCCCFLSYFIIKPQLLPERVLLHMVVSYLISSSNHN